MFTRAVYVFWLVQRFLENSNLMSFKEIDIWESNWDTYMIVRKEYKYWLYYCETEGNQVNYLGLI